MTTFGQSSKTVFWENVKAIFWHWYQIGQVSPAYGPIGWYWTGLQRWISCAYWMRFYSNGGFSQMMSKYILELHVENDIWDSKETIHFLISYVELQALIFITNLPPSQKSQDSPSSSYFYCVYTRLW